MSLEVLLPLGWSPPVGYANGIAVPTGRIVFVAGQVGWDEKQQFHSDKLIPQFEQALKNVLAVLAQAGGGPNHICRMTAYCVDKPAYLSARPELGRIWRKLMGRHAGNRKSRTDLADDRSAGLDRQADCGGRATLYSGA